MSIRTVKLTVTTASNGSGTATAVSPAAGWLEAVDWIDGTLSDGVDATLTVTGTDSATDHTLLTLTNADNDAVYYPRRVVDTTAGAAATGVYDRFVFSGYLVLSVTSGGNAKTGGCVIYYEACD